METSEQVTALLGGLSTTAGAVVILAAMIGFMRMPDVYCRSHALGVGMTLGFALLAIGLRLDLGPAAGPKLLAAVVFQLATVPVSAHLLMLQARRGQVAHTKSDRPARSARSAGRQG